MLTSVTLEAVKSSTCIEPPSIVLIVVMPLYVRLYWVIDGVDRCQGVWAATSPPVVAAFRLTAELGTQLGEPVEVGVVGPGTASAGALVPAATFGKTTGFELVVWTAATTFVPEFVLAAATAGAAEDVFGSGAEPKIHVHMPFSQPQNPPLDDGLDVLGLGVGVAGSPPFGALAAPVLPEADADGEADALREEAPGVGVGPAVFFVAALAEEPVVEGVAEADALVLVAVVLPQTVGNGNGVFGPAAIAGAASATAPITPATAIGAAIT